MAWTDCPNCGKGQLVPYTRDEVFDFDLGDGETVKVCAENVPVVVCNHCEELMSGPAAAKIRHEAICRAAGLLAPSEISALREEIGWSRQHLANLTGIKSASIARWEGGQLLQNRGNDTLLKAIRDCPEMRKYLEQQLKEKGRQQTPRPE